MKKLLTILWTRRATRTKAYWDSIRRAEQAHWDHVLRQKSKTI